MQKHLLFIALLFFCSCIAVEPLTEAYKSPKFQRNASFKVVTAYTQDEVLGTLENLLLAQQFTIISDNHIRVQAPAGTVMVNTMDTTYAMPRYELHDREIFKEQPADYVIRYDYSLKTFSHHFNHFNASVVNTRTGEIEFSYVFKEGVGGATPLKNAHQVLKDFVFRMSKE